MSAARLGLLLLALAACGQQTHDCFSGACTAKTECAGAVSGGACPTADMTCDVCGADGGFAARLSCAAYSDGGMTWLPIVCRL